MCKLVSQLNSECSEVWRQVYAQEPCWDACRRAGERWELRSERLTEVIFVESSSPSLSPLCKAFSVPGSGDKRDDRSTIQKYCFSFTPCYPKVTCFYTVWFNGNYSWYRNRLEALWMNLKKEVQIEADKSVPGCVVVSERVGSKWFPKGKE